ncbi:hypothetical protein [Streptacidiphilus jiangxiensis]|uniref:Uncharacterized protein n=1 Tax=Streptacidiphilus jiangxiensis TaxID=235985 RepID=A0A1H7Z205_STRJI|nr:hypothetical protein [Streptacidiphilus jiangxiensis]SEM52500.1 hypothetical protein SAMN05414137_13233 [Streptacidiphilus jiangxiensis]
MRLRDVLPDSERLSWILDPFESVGPLRFGMTSAEVSAALEGCVPGLESGTAFRIYPEEVGLEIHYDEADRLWAVSVDALRGPQVQVDGMPLVGRVPSELEAWLFERAENRGLGTDVVYLPGAQAGSNTLGVVLCVQRAGDRLLTRPVFLPAEAMDDVYHMLPQEAWDHV